MLGSILVTGAQPRTCVLSVNIFTKSHNKSFSQQSQHFQKPLIIFPHLTWVNQITRKNPRFLHVNRRMKTFLDSHNQFRALASGQKSASISISPNRFHLENLQYFLRPMTFHCQQQSLHFPDVFLLLFLTPK